MYNISTSGLYYVYPDISPEAFIPVEVWCDMVTDGGGWTVSRNVVCLGLYTSSYYASGAETISDSNFRDPEPEWLSSAHHDDIRDISILVESRTYVDGFA